MPIKLGLFSETVATFALLDETETKALIEAMNSDHWIVAERAVQTLAYSNANRLRTDVAIALEQDLKRTAWTVQVPACRALVRFYAQRIVEALE